MVRGNDRGHNGETEAGATGSSSARDIPACKAFEEGWDIRVKDSRAVIGDGQNRDTICSLESYVNSRPRWSVHPGIR